MGESANLLSVGAVDFGIIVDSAVILVENIFRNFQRDEEEKQGLLQRLAEGFWGPDPTRHREHDENAGRMDRPPADDPDQRDAGGQGGAVLGAHHGGRFRAAVHHAGRGGPDFRPHGAHLRLRLAGALIATFTVTPVLASLLLPEHVKETETIVVRAPAPRSTTRRCASR